MQISVGLTAVGYWEGEIPQQAGTSFYIYIYKHSSLESIYEREHSAFSITGLDFFLFRINIDSYMH